MTSCFPVDAVVPVRKLQDVGVEAGLGHGVAKVEDVDVHAGIVDEEVALHVANVDELSARM